jgi:transposase
MRIIVGVRIISVKEACVDVRSDLAAHLALFHRRKPRSEALFEQQVDDALKLRLIGVEVGHTKNAGPLGRCIRSTSRVPDGVRWVAHRASLWSAISAEWKEKSGGVDHMERPAPIAKVKATDGSQDAGEYFPPPIRGLAQRAPEPHAKEPVVDGSITWVGLDAHKKAISVAAAFPGRPLEQWTADNTVASVRRLVRKLEREARGSEVRCCYEAGPCGYALKRQLEREGKVVCEVVAPSLIPIKPGERIKTDRRDAKKLCEMLRAGLLTEVHPPTPDQEAVRDLCRCREDAKADLHRSRHRLGKLLLRRAMVWHPDKKAWSRAHRQWLRTVRFDLPTDQAVFDDYLLAIEHLEERIKNLDTKLAAVADEPLYREHVGWLRCFRGIDTTTAITILAELHGVQRFHSPRQLAAYLGLVPSEYSSSDRTRRGSITKAGNGHIRRVLIEASWHYRHPPGVGAALSKRRARQPARVIAIADRAQQRLHRRYRRLTERGKPANKAVVATARELVAFLWAALQPPMSQDFRESKKTGARRHRKEKRAA